MTEPTKSQQQPGLLDCALLLLEDGCPPEADVQLCRLQEDDEDGTMCRRCWTRYLFYVVNGRQDNPYRLDRFYEGGMIG